MYWGGGGGDRKSEMGGVRVLACFIDNIYVYWEFLNNKTGKFSEKRGGGAAGVPLAHP